MSMSPTLLWLLAGALLCLLELFLPTAFAEFMMGIAAFIVAGISLIIPSLTIQVFLWLLLSPTLILLFRRLLPKPKITGLEEDNSGKTLTAILPGEEGRILYEGNSWRARCADEHQTIDPQEKVLIVGREGNTLIIIPERSLHS